MIKDILWIILMTLVVDAMGWAAWALSGQFPVDNWYVGTITSHIIEMFA